jgi:hypothetical protein
MDCGSSSNGSPSGTNNQDTTANPGADSIARGPDAGAASRGGGERHEVMGDVNLGFVMLFLMLLQLMNYTMRDPCTC